MMHFAERDELWVTEEGRDNVYIFKNASSEPRFYQILMTETEQNGFQKIGRFWLDPNVIKRVTSTIEEQALSPSVIFIDEVGRLEDMEGLQKVL